MIRDLRIYNGQVSLSPSVNPRFRLMEKSFEWDEKDNNGPIEVTLRWPKDREAEFLFKMKYLTDGMHTPGAFIISTLPLVYELGPKERAVIQLHFREILAVGERVSVFSDFPSHDLFVQARAVKLVVQQHTGNPYGEAEEGAGA